MKRLFSFLFILMGSGVLILWGYLIATGQVVEFESEPFGITTHILSESIMALTLIFGGVSYLFEGREKGLLLGLGMLLYSLVNSSGYYLDLDNNPMVVVFVLLLLVVVIYLWFESRWP